MASLEEQLGALYLQSLVGGQGETAGYGMMPPQPMQPVVPTPVMQPMTMAPITQIHPAIQSAFQTALMNQAMLATQTPPFNPANLPELNIQLPEAYQRLNFANVVLPNWLKEKKSGSDEDGNTTTTPAPTGSAITMTPINFGGLLGR